MAQLCPSGRPADRDPTRHGKGGGLEEPVPGVQAQQRPRSPRTAVGATARTGAEAGAGKGPGPGLSHLVTRRSVKALIPWAAFSRVSSLAGGPCQRTKHHGVDTPCYGHPEGPAWAQDRPPQPLTGPGRVQGLALDTWTRSCCLGWQGLGSVAPQGR